MLRWRIMEWGLAVFQTWWLETPFWGDLFKLRCKGRENTSYTVKDGGDSKPTEQSRTGSWRRKDLAWSIWTRNKWWVKWKTIIAEQTPLLLRLPGRDGEHSANAWGWFVQATNGYASCFHASKTVLGAETEQWPDRQGLILILMKLRLQWKETIYELYNLNYHKEKEK